MKGKIWRVLVQYDNGVALDSTSEYMTRAEAEAMRERECSRITSFGWIMDVDGRLERYGGTRYEHAPPYKEEVWQ